MPTVRLAPLALATAAACAACARPEPAPAWDVDVVFVAGDSAYWLASEQGVPRLRGAPLWLVRTDGRFRELYGVDIDRSHRNAVFIGQVLWVRELLAGDSVAVAADTSVLALQADYAQRTPWDPPAAPDDPDLAENPVIDAAAEIVPLDVVGPYLGIEIRTDVETADSTLHRHETRRGAVDLRTNRRVTLAEVVGARAREVAVAGEAAWRRARDSVLADTSEAGRAAALILEDFPFDPSSFTVTLVDGEPAISFVVPGRGERAGGYVLPLAPIPIPRPAWWTPSLRVEEPRDSLGTRRWIGERYDVLFVPDDAGERAEIRLLAADRPVTVVGRVPMPVRRLWRLDQLAADAPERMALARAFNDAGLYGTDVRAAARRVAPTGPTLFRPVNRQ